MSLIERSDLFRYLGTADPTPAGGDVYTDAIAYGNDQATQRLEPWPADAGDPPEPYRYVALRFAARYLSARGAPLGAVDLGEFGSAPLYARDPEISHALALYGRAGIA